MTAYAHPDVLVSTAWVAAHANDPNVRLVESDEDVLLYDVVHWIRQMVTPPRRTRA